MPQNIEMKMSEIILTKRKNREQDVRINVFGNIQMEYKNKKDNPQMLNGNPISNLGLYIGDFRNQKDSNKL